MSRSRRGRDRPAIKIRCRMAHCIICLLFVEKKNYYRRSEHDPRKAPVERHRYVGYPNNVECFIILVAIETCNDEPNHTNDDGNSHIMRPL